MNGSILCLCCGLGLKSDTKPLDILALLKDDLLGTTVLG